MVINRVTITQMEHVYRAGFINSLLGAKPALMVGTADKNGRTNLAIMSSAFHLGANPPLVGLIIRPSATPQHTLNNILETGCYTLNHVNPTYLEAAHQTSAQYPVEQCEFDAVGLTQKYNEGFSAPFVEQSAIALGLTLVEHQPLQINDTHLIIGEIQLVDLPPNLIGQDGFVDISLSDSVAVTGLDCYNRLQPLKRLSYAKVDSWPKKIE